ncbi:hypothetical protein GCK32_012492 [Trichostrongylus colubriformis]|uniref:Uncharacterized protein n=1 Tax=Trichostrongylus colubriformis TaxID=6319 RepID=A0AAN8GEC5_TRICO
MRSKCDIDTMLNAMGGSTPAANPPAKRSRPVPSKQELKKRVEAILKKLATRGNISEKPTSTIVANTVAEEDPTGAQEWYEGEDGPSISNSPVPHTDSASAEEERLNAVVQTKVRSYIAKAAARRHEMRRIRIQQSSFQTAQPQAQTLEPSLPHQSITLASSENFNEQDGLLSFDSPYAEHLGEDSSTHSVHPEDLIQHSHTSFVQDLSISDTTHSHNPLLGSLDLHSPVGDDEFHSLFGEYDFI